MAVDPSVLRRPKGATKIGELVWSGAAHADARFADLRVIRIARVLVAAYAGCVQLATLIGISLVASMPGCDGYSYFDCTWGIGACPALFACERMQPLCNCFHVPTFSAQSGPQWYLQLLHVCHGDVAPVYDGMDRSLHVLRPVLLVNLVDHQPNSSWRVFHLHLHRCSSCIDSCKL